MIENKQQRPILIPSFFRVFRSRSGSSALYVSQMFSVGGDGAVFCPRPSRLEVFGTGHADRLGVVNFGQEDVGRELLFLPERGVRAGGNGLLDFGARESIGGGGEFLQFECRGIAAAGRVAASGDVSCCGVAIGLGGRFWDAEIAFGPFIQHVETPGARPCGAAAQKILPHGLREAAVEAGFERGRPIAELDRDAFPQFTAQPGFPWESESALGQFHDFVGQQILQRFDQQRFRARGIALQRFGQLQDIFDERPIEEGHAHF
jgi:hypothetical protein